MAELPAEAVQAAAEALRTKQWGNRPSSAHASHKFHMDCEICHGNLAAMAEVAAPVIAQHIGNLLDWRALEAAERGTWHCHHGTPGCHQTGSVVALAAAAREVREMFSAGVGSPVSCPSVAPESTHSPQNPSAAPVYRSGVERPAETLSALREQIARVRDLHQPTDGMGFNCDEDPTPGSYGRIAQVCTSCGTPGEQGVRWPCPTIRALDGAGAVPEEQTGGGNG